MVLLIEPPSTMQKLQRIKSKRPHLGAPLGLIYVASYLQRAGIEAEILDMRIASRAELGRHLQTYKPLLAGISIMPGHALPLATKLSGFIKKHSPQTKTVWGGSFPSLHQELCLAVPSVDYVVCGDGEVTLTELARYLQNAPSVDGLRQIRGLAFRHNGKVTLTQPREPVSLDLEPVGAWNLVEKYLPYYLGPHKYLAICTARGCPFKCSFCYNNLLYKGFKRYRVKSVENVLTEINYLTEKHQINKLQFMDDDFLGNRRRGLELMARINGRYPRMKFHIAARIDELLDEDVIEQIARKGCETVFLGVESASPQQLTDMKKGHTTNQTVEVAKLCRKYDIIPTYSFTCGYPDETRDDLFAGVELARMLKEIDPRCECIMEIISPIAGTPLFNELQERNQLPEMKPSRWCYLTDWKSARQKPWIVGHGFYEAYQLAFFIAFSARGHSSGLHTVTRCLSAWARYRLAGKKPRLLMEFRLLNYLVKRALWGLTG